MPELPEIEHLRRTLEPHLLCRRILSVQLHRPDYLAEAGGDRRSTRRRLLEGQSITGLQRHGKQLAIEGDQGGIVLLHLGMSGQVRFQPHDSVLDRPQRDHIHCVWRLGDAPSGVKCRGRLIIRDPRRFGGIWTYPSFEELLLQRWRALGPDALTIRADSLARSLARTNRPIKAVLLDQFILAGVGNIYADEALFRARIHPATIANRIQRVEVVRLATSIRAVLRAAVTRGGSTLRDYIDANGQSGRYRSRHLVYGRSGEPCRSCRTTLERHTIAQRTTVWCPSCQRR